CGRAGGGGLPFVQVLQSGDFDALLAERVNAPRRRVRCSQRGDTGYIVANRGAPNRFLIVERFAAERRVDDQIDFPGFDQVHDIGSAFVDLEDTLRVDSGSFESRSRAARGEQVKPREASSLPSAPRSEERRVGKEGRGRWERYRE